MSIFESNPPGIIILLFSVLLALPLASTVKPHRRSNDEVMSIFKSNPTAEQQQSYTSPENTGDREYYLPVANITRVMRRVIPPNAKIADDAKETVQQCVTEYINMVTSEANDRCHGEERRTITADDILWAMGRLGFDNYVGHLSLFLDRYRNLQREWNEESAEPLRRRAADFERLPPPTHGLLPAFPPGDVFGRSSADAMAGMNMGYYPNNAGASSSSSSARQDGGPSFGPYAQFKR